MVGEWIGLQGQQCAYWYLISSPAPHQLVEKRRDFITLENMKHKVFR